MRRILAVAVYLLGVVQGAIIGIDLGSNYLKVASVRPGTPFHIVLDEQSKRKVDNVVAFDSSERLFGNHASQMMIRKGTHAFAMASRLLGKKLDSADVKFFQDRHYPYQFVELEGRSGAVGFQLGDAVYSPEELVGMLLEYVLKLSADDAESPVKDAVITVPDYWTQIERQSMLDAAELAGVNVLSLINENTAVATQYAVDVKFNATEPPFNVIFYNMGANSLQVSLVEYSSYVQSSRKENKTVGQFEIISKASRPFLGAQAFDQVIFEKLIEEANEFFAGPKGGNLKDFDIRTVPRAMGKLRAAAATAKTKLSANKEVPINIGSLHNDRDFKSNVKRDKFQEWSSHLLAQSADPIADVLEESGLKVEDIRHIVLVGGGVRIPAVQKNLKEFLGRDELAQNLNGDEAMCFGAVFRAANLSTAFKVRSRGMIDTTLYPIGVRLSDHFPDPEEVETAVSEGLEPKAESEEASADSAAETSEKSDSESTNSAGAGDAGAELEIKEKIKPAVVPAEPGSFSKRASLFKHGNVLAKRKTVAFSHNGDVVCSVQHDSVEKYLLPGTGTEISRHNITGVNKLLLDEKNFHLFTFQNETQKPRIALSFSLDSSGIATMVKAEATLDEMVKVPYTTRVPRNVTSSENTTDDESNDGDEGVEDGTDKEKKIDANEKEAAAEEADDNKDQKPVEEGEDKKDSDEAKTEASGEGSGEGSGENEPKDAADEEKTEKPKKKKKRIEYDVITEYKEQKKTHRFPLKVESVPSEDNIKPMTRMDFSAARKVMRALKAKDDRKKEIGIALNSLESYIYSTRNAMSTETVEQVTTEEQREEVTTATREAEDWLYDQDSDTDPSVYRNKTKELEALAKPIFLREVEMQARPAILESAAELINLTRSTLDDWNTTRPWIPLEERERLLNMTDMFDTWLANKTEVQSELQAHEPPVFTSNQVRRKLEPIAKLATDLSKLKKPIEKEDKKDKKKKDKKKAKKNATDETNPEATAEEETEAEDLEEGQEKEASADEKEASADAGDAEPQSDATSESTGEDAAERKDEL